MKKLKNINTEVERVVEKVVVSTPTVVDEDGGLGTLLGKKVLFHCMNYNYIGILIGVNTTCIELDDAQVVFDTGPYTSENMKNAEYVHKKRLFLQTGAIESFWEVK